MAHIISYGMSGGKSHTMYPDYASMWPHHSFLIAVQFISVRGYPNQRHLNFDCFSSFKASIHPYESKLIFLV
jgi:hypothetical protein